jgi:hypothetical protein
VDKVPATCGTIRGSPNSRQKASLSRVVQGVAKEELVPALHDSQSFEKFRNFLERKGTGVEHIVFWKVVEDYKALTNPHDRKSKGLMIYNSFFLKDISLYGFQLAEEIVKELKKNIQADRFEPELFDETQKAVLSEIETRFFPEFVKTEFRRTFSPEDVTPNSTSHPQEKKGETAESEPEDVIEFHDDLDNEPLIQTKEKSPRKVTADSSPPKKDKPPEYTDLPGNSWYFGVLDRKASEKILSSGGVDSFLVRNSAKKNCYALSVYYAATDSFIHFIIAPTQSGYHLQDCNHDSNSYSSLTELIEKTPVVRDKRPAGTFHKRS